MPPIVPYSHRYDGRCQRRSRESFPFFCRCFDTMTAVEITWQPWVTMLEGFKDQVTGAREASCFRLLLEGPVCRVWFVGEQFLCQTIGFPELVVPMPPLTYMRAIEKYTMQEMIDFTRGWDVDFFRVEGDYIAFIQTYLMPSLAGARGGERSRVPAAGERGRGVGATRAHGRRGSRARQRTRWPELPTALT
ncbi:unnamed protein product [Camellia sinensis]